MDNAAAPVANPLVSVIIPFNRGATELQQACRSVQQQGFTRWEVLLIDDYAPRDCAAVARTFASEDRRFRLLHVPAPHSPGPWLARNVGVAAARGQWVAFLDADDIWHPDKLEYQLALHSRGVQISACTYDRFLMRNGKPILIERRTPPKTLSFTRLLRGNVIPLSATMLARELLIPGNCAVDPNRGPFIPERHEDYGLWLRLLARHPKVTWASREESLMAYRLHAMGISNNRIHSIFAVNQLFTDYAPALKRLFLLVIWALDRILTSLLARLRARRTGRLPTPFVLLLSQV